MKTLIAQLNHVFDTLRSEGTSPLVAIAQVAGHFMLIQVTDEPPRRLYLAADGTLVNCWTDIESKLGFDADAGWHFDDLVTQTEAARISGVSLQAIHQAIRTSRLRAYRTDAPSHHGRTKVRRYDVEQLYSPG